MGHVSAVGRTGGSDGFGVANQALLGGCGPGMASTGLGEGVKRAGPGLPECVQILIASLQDPSLVCWTREEEGWLLNQPHDPSIPCAIFSRLSSSMDDFP